METYTIFCTHFKNSWGPNYDLPFLTWLRLVHSKQTKWAAAFKSEERNIRFLNISAFYLIQEAGQFPKQNKTNGNIYCNTPHSETFRLDLNYTVLCQNQSGFLRHQTYSTLERIKWGVYWQVTEYDSRHFSYLQQVSLWQKYCHQLYRTCSHLTLWWQIGCS